MLATNGGIYKILSIQTGRFYIGSSNNIDKRFREHINYLKRNLHHSAYLQNHFNKYGLEDFELSRVENILQQEDQSVESYKELLIEKEQYYINILKPEFNMSPTAGSVLGIKKPNSKYYHFAKDQNAYCVTYKVNGRTVKFNQHKYEEDAITQVELIKTLSVEELLKYYEDNVRGKNYERLVNQHSKHYTFEKQMNKWKVTRPLQKGKKACFGFFDTEQEAKERADYLKTLIQEELQEFFKSLPKHTVKSRPSSDKNYNFDKKSGKYLVRFTEGCKRTSYGYYKTEEEAKERVAEIRALIDRKYD